jgi:capsular exopolysaccharide synthesis family protein
MSTSHQLSKSNGNAAGAVAVPPSHDVGIHGIPVRKERPRRASGFRGFSRIVKSCGLNPAFRGKVMTNGEMNPVSLEQYRRLAAALHHTQLERGIKRAMVASAVAGEGKTLTALNLALTLSASYHRRVLLIDADLRCPRVHELLGVENASGLNDALTNTRQSRASLLAVSPRLSVLLAGRPNPDPMSALTSARMGQVLNKAAESYDWVIVDTPPVVMLPDTSLLAAMIEVAVLVIRAGRTSCDLVDRAIAALGRDRVLGVVLNCVDEENLSEYASSPYLGSSTGSVVR